MNFIDQTAADFALPLKAAHCPFPRAEELREQMKWVVTKYYTEVASRKSFEAHGLLVTGLSRLGKTQEIAELITAFNSGNNLMPDGRPARIIRCLLSRKVSWKELGLITADALGYPVDGRRNQNYIWRAVREQARRQGVIGIAYDECQHVFTEEGVATNKIFLDSFKTLQKDLDWPLILILSGVPELEKYILPEEQLRHLLRPVRFDPINLSGDPDDNGLSKDLEQINGVAYFYSDIAGLCFDPLSTIDFFERLSYACAGRWGLVIELIIDALVRCKSAGETDVTIKHFVNAYSEKSGMNPGFSPFTAPDYRECFDPEKLLEILRRSDG